MPSASPLRCRPPASGCGARLHLRALLGLGDHSRAVAAHLLARRRRLRARMSVRTARFLAFTGAPECTKASSHSHRSPVPLPGWSYLSCNLVRLGAKSPYTTSTCDSRQCAAGRFAQLLDFIERLDVRRVNWRKKYDYAALESARHRLVSHYCRNATSELKLFWRL